METYFNYIIESGISLGVFTLIYWLLLRKEVLLKVSRIYLLVAVLFSTLLPFLSIDLGSWIKSEPIVKATNEEVLTTNLLETITVTASGFPARVGEAIVSIKPSMWFYIVGATLVLFFLVTGIAQLLSIISHNRRFRLKMAKLIISSKAISPYSFFNYIFISRDLPEQENWKAIVHHELEHVRQGHSFDVLFVDFMMVFQWFNPFYWIIRRLVRENHEFLADRAVIQRGKISTGNYKALLLSQAIGGSPVMTSNFFNVKSIQKRFKMITKNKTGKYSFLKYALGVMAALTISMCFAVSNEPKDINAQRSNIFNSGDGLMSDYVVNQVSVKSEIVEIPRSESGDSINVKPKDEHRDEDVIFMLVEDMPEFPGGEKALREWIAGKIKYPKVASEQRIQGKVYITFVVEKDGSIRRAKVARGVDPSLDIEALRVVNEMPAWKPGKQRGKEVAVSYTVPINFQLNGPELTAKNDEPVVVNEDVFVIVEDMPEYPGGEEVLRKWIAENVKYPVSAAEKGIMGKVYVQFVVEKDGRIGRAKVVRGVDPSLDTEALRVVNNMPIWKPGKQRGKEVAVSYTIPINFSLGNEVKGQKIDETVVVGYGKKEVSTKDSIYLECEQMPVFAGGDLELRKFIATKIRYPGEALKYGEVGKVFVTFVVAKDGSIEKVRVVRGVSPALDNEAIRVVSSMPNWTPGKHKGETVSVQYTIPVNFQLE
jgi:TonB family protein